MTMNNESSMLQLANEWRGSNGYLGKGGVIVVHQNIVQSWLNGICDPHHWCPGCFAITEAGSLWEAVDGDSVTGAKAWRLLRYKWADVALARELAYKCAEIAEEHGYEIETEQLGVSGNEFKITNPKTGYSSATFLDDCPAWIQCALDNEIPHEQSHHYKQALSVLCGYETPHYCEDFAAFDIK